MITKIEEKIMEKENYAVRERQNRVWCNVWKNVEKTKKTSMHKQVDDKIEILMGNKSRIGFGSKWSGWLAGGIKLANETTDWNLNEYRKKNNSNHITTLLVSVLQIQ